MTKSTKHLLKFICLSLGLLLVSGAISQEERWFRVELLIFSNESGASEISEVWNPTPTLSYPDQRRFLFDPVALEKNMALYNATGIADEFGYQTLTVIAPTTKNEELAVPADLDIQNTRGSGILGAPDSKPGEPAIEAPEVGQAITPRPFTLLPRSELEFRGKAAHMAGTGRYRILFHESWLQPFANQSNAIPIVIDRSGDLEDWPRLQGSIKLYLSRYLHLETDLWLNTHGSYLPGQWQMPPPPLGPKSLAVIYPPEPEPELEEQPEAINQTDAFGVAIDDADVTVEALEPLGPIYPWRHAILLQQKRKMRSTEVHYIDHPLLGMVIKISPVTEEELLQRATAEATAAQTAP